MRTSSGRQQSGGGGPRAGVERDLSGFTPSSDAVAALDELPYVLDLGLLGRVRATRHGAGPLVELLSRDQTQILSRRHGHDHFLVGAGGTHMCRYRQSN